jgi:hypothetical protein
VDSAGVSAGDCRYAPAIGASEHKDDAGHQRGDGDAGVLELVAQRLGQGNASGPAPSRSGNTGR